MRGIPLTFPKEDDDALHEADWKILAAAFVVGEVVMDDPFKDPVMQMDAWCVETGDPKAATLWAVMKTIIQITYEGTPTGSLVRMWLLDVFTNHAPHDTGP